MKTLAEAIKRLGEIDVEIRAALDNDTLDTLEAEKTELIARKAELEAFEQRKATAAGVASGAVKGTPFESRIHVAKTIEPETMTRSELLESKDYYNGFYKRLAGEQLSEIEQRSIALTNIVVPTQTNEEIIKKMRIIAPMLNEITLLRVNGNVNIAVEGTNNAADLHTENAALTAQADTLTTVSLSGYEVNKLVRLSKSAMTMGVSGLETYLTDILSENIATKIEAYILYGTGSSQPKGVNASNSWTDTTNGVDWASTAPTYAEICELISYLGGGYAKRAKFVMSHATYWQNIANIKDDSKYPIAVMDGVSGTYRCMGYPVLISDQMTAGEIFFGDFKKVVGNLAQDITIASDFNLVYNAYDILGSAIFDCDIADASAFVKSEATLA